MAITDELVRLGQSAKVLNDGSDRLNALIARIDEHLGRLTIGLDYVLPRPVAELVTYDEEHKRVIELSYAAYLRFPQGHHLALKTVKVMESRKAAASEVPGAVIPLLEAPRRLRYSAVDHLPALVEGLSQQMHEIVSTLEQRCRVASSLEAQLARMVDANAPIPDPSTADHIRAIADAQRPAGAGEVRAGRAARRRTNPRF
jgi:hypothetical protein